MIRASILAAVALAMAVSTADARPRHVAHNKYDPACNVSMPCEGVPVVKDSLTAQSRAGSPQRAVQRASYGGGSIIGGRPSGCPRAFCGCGASLRLFGKIVPRLNLARNWFSFPRANPAPGMVAVRRHHVFVLERHISGSTWLAHDSNSGGGKTRLHARSIAGFVIVNPNGDAS